MNALEENVNRELFEKYAKREKFRAIASFISAGTAIISGILALRALRDDRARSAAASAFKGEPL